MQNKLPCLNLTTFENSAFTSLLDSALLFFVPLHKRPEKYEKRPKFTKNDKRDKEGYIKKERTKTTGKNMKHPGWHFVSFIIF